MNLVVGNVPQHQACQERIGNIVGHEHGCRNHESCVENQIAKSHREHQSESVLGEGVMDAVDEEVDDEYFRVIREPVVFGMEEESMEQIFGKGPGEESDEHNYRTSLLLPGVVEDKEGDPGQEAHGNHPPRGFGEGLHEFVLKEPHISDGIYKVLWFVDELNVLIPLQIGIHQLLEHWFRVVDVQLREQFVAIHSLRLDGLFFRICTDQQSHLLEVPEDQSGSLGVLCLFKRLVDHLADVLLYLFHSARMADHVVGDFVDGALEGNELLVGLLRVGFKFRLACKIDHLYLIMPF